MIRKYGDREAEKNKVGFLCVCVCISITKRQNMLMFRLISGCKYVVQADSILF